MNAVDPPTMPATKAITFYLPGSYLPYKVLLRDGDLLSASSL
jgi:hypothetical protein